MMIMIFSGRDYKEGELLDDIYLNRLKRESVTKSTLKVNNMDSALYNHLKNDINDKST
jgi:hypothetical protein